MVLKLLVASLEWFDWPSPSRLQWWRAAALPPGTMKLPRDSADLSGDLPGPAGGEVGEPAADRCVTNGLYRFLTERERERERKTHEAERGRQGDHCP